MIDFVLNPDIGADLTIAVVVPVQIGALSLNRTFRIAKLVQTEHRKWHDWDGNRVVCWWNTGKESERMKCPYCEIERLRIALSDLLTAMTNHGNCGCDLCVRAVETYADDARHALTTDQQSVAEGGGE